MNQRQYKRSQSGMNRPGIPFDGQLILLICLAGKVQDAASSRNIEDIGEPYDHTGISWSFVQCTSSVASAQCKSCCEKLHRLLIFMAYL